MTSRKSYAVLTISFAVVLVSLLAFAFASSRKVARLSFSAGQSGGAYNPIAESIAELIEGETSAIRLEVVSSDGSALNADRISSGEAQLALLQNDTPGDDTIRSLVPLQSGALHFLAREEAMIEGLGDLEGKKVGVGLPASGSHRLVTELLRHFEVDLEEIELRPLTIQAACAQLEEGKVDALLMVIGLKTEVIDDLVAGGEVEFVPIGRHAGTGSVIEGFRLTNPFVESWLIPRHCYAMPHGDMPGVPPEAVPTLSVRSVLVARRDVSNPVAREITRIVIENRNRLTRMHPDGSLLDEGLRPEQFQFPLHDGAAQYYNRNEPGFLVRYADIIGLLFSFLLAGYGMIRTGRGWFLQRQKDRIDAYYLELNGILDAMLKPMELEELTEVESRLQGIRSKALKQLSAESLVPDESFRIFQTVLAEAGAQVRAKRAELG